MLAETNASPNSLSMMFLRTFPETMKCLLVLVFRG